MTGWVRSGVMEGAPELVRELGGDFAGLAQEAGVPVDPLANPDLPMPAACFIRFMELAPARLGDQTFGLKLGLRQTFGLFGAMAELFNSAATIGELLRDLADFLPLHTQGTIAGLRNERGGTDFTYELATGSGGYQRQLIELGFGVLLGELRRHCPDWVPADVRLRHDAPADRSMHRRLFGDTVQFNSDCNAILIDAAMLARPTVAGNREVHTRLFAQFGAAARSAGMLEAIRTEALVRMVLPFAPIDLGIAARMLRRSRRTLQRRLEGQGTSFADIVDGVRANLALSYLVESALPIGAIAEILQFSETSALTRAVRRWHGMSPRALRQGALLSQHRG